jgi:chromosome segregation ATPase
MAQSNGIDLGTIYTLLTEIAEKVTAHDGRFDAVDRRFEAIDRHLEAVDRQLREMRSDIGGLREAVTSYHATVLGHGILISELDERVRRIERHLDLAPGRG